METVNERSARYRQTIQALFTWMTGGPNAEPEIYDHTLFDVEQDRYAIISVGWHRGQRISDLIAHVEIIHGQVWIQSDNTDLNIARKLEQEGIAKDDIVLGFRQHSVEAVMAMEAMAA
jgi:hypothetical protein